MTTNLRRTTPDDRPAVVLIAHGSRREAANDELRDLAARLADTGPHEPVVAAFLELAEPGIVAAGDRCVALGARRVLLIPYFLSEGIHTTRDLAAARDELADRHAGVDFVLAPPLGPHPLLDRLVALRIAQAEAADPARADATAGAAGSP